MKNIILGLLLVYLSITTGCASQMVLSTNYDSTYVPAASLTKKSDKPIFIYTTSEDNSYRYVGRPNSFTGSALSISVPLGQITKEISLKVFCAKHSRCQSISEIAEIHDGIIIHPKATSFTYEFNQLRNAGFAITPEIDLVLLVEQYNNHGEIMESVSLNSGHVSGESYFINSKPEEKINILVHKTIFNLLDEYSNNQ